MANGTGDGNFTSKVCFVLSAPPTGVIKLFTALNIFLSITASLGNALILVALHKVSSIYAPTKRFFRCLAVTDLWVGLIVQPLCTTEMSPFINMDVHDLFHTLSWCLCGVSVLMSTAISVDRLLALLLGMQYILIFPKRRSLSHENVSKQNV